MSSHYLFIARRTVRHSSAFCGGPFERQPPYHIVQCVDQGPNDRRRLTLYNVELSTLSLQKRRDLRRAVDRA